MKSIFLTLLFILLPLSSFAQLSEQVPGIIVKTNGKFSGQFAKAYYVIGRNLILDDPSQVKTNEIRATQLTPIQGKDFAFPGIELQKAGVFVIYNFVVMVISNDPNDVLYNPDGEIAPGQVEKVATVPSAKIVISRNQLREWENSNPGTPYVVQLP